MRDGGQCGILIPSGIYTDPGAKQLWTMLFEQAHVTGLFCIKNRKEIFENAYRSLNFVVLTFAKGARTERFAPALMRHDVPELERFAAHGAIEVSVGLVRRLSPDSLSVM